MKTQISRDSHDPSKRYSGVYLQQGRMILDADWNEATEVQRRQLLGALGDAVLSGAPRQGGLSLSTVGGLHIVPGRLYVDGIPAELPASLVSLSPTAQPDYPNPPTLSGDVRFYADVWERTLTALEDADLMDPGLHGADTATRTQTLLQVKWCAIGTDPLNAPDNLPLGDAPLALRLRKVVSGPDPCDPCTAEVAVDERIGNYLFRVEVHEVYRTGGKLFLILKWSRDNGAEAYAVSQAPGDFKSGDWIWEFYDTPTEKLLGNHLPLTQRRRRGLLREAYSPPAGAGEPKAFARQWDGYAEINLTDLKLVQGRDRGMPLSAGLDVSAHGWVGFHDGRLQINLELMELDLALAAKGFVAGDYWLAAVREAVDESGSYVLGKAPAVAGGPPAGAPPQGVGHHYLRLDDFIGGVLVHPSDTTADAFRRRMHFPPLTDLHADEVLYGPPAGCTGIYGTAENVKQALDALCSLDAADIAYNLNCPPGNNLASLLAATLGAAWPNLDGQPKSPSVQDMLQALLCHLSAAQIPYGVPGCASSPNLAQGLGLAVGPNNVAAVLNRLLCNLDAEDVPLNLPALQCQDLKDSGETSVQGALDYLCATRISHCALSIPAEPKGQLEKALRDFAKDAQAKDLWLCLMPGEHDIPGGALNVSGKNSLRLSAAAAGASTIYFSGQPASFQAQELGLEGVRCRFASGSRLTLQANRISASRCSFTRTGSAENPPPMVRLDALGEGSEVYWRDNVMSDTWSHPSDNAKDWFTPDRVGNVRVASLIEQMRANPGMLEDARVVRERVGQLARAISEMSGRERLAWRDRVRGELPVAGGGRPPRPRATETAMFLDRAPLITALSNESALSHLGPAKVGAVSRDEAKVLTEAAIDKINAAGADIGLITDIVIDDFLVTFYELGYGVALALGDTTLSGALSDNHIDGEVLLMNGQESGIDAGKIRIEKNEIADRTVAPKRGRLTLSGNRFQRFWARLPPGTVSGNSLRRAVPGYEALTLMGNLFNGFGHAAMAAMLTAQGNQFHFENGNPEQVLGNLITDRAALTGNAASSHTEAPALTVAARASAIGVNMVQIKAI